MTLSVLDITDPSNRQLVGTTLVTNGSSPRMRSGVSKISAVALGNGLFTVSEAEVNGNPELVLANPSDPNNIVVTYTPVSAYVNEMAASGNALYATSSTSSQGLTIFNIGQLETIPVTVSVEVPNANGVSIVPDTLGVPGAFNKCATAGRSRYDGRHRDVEWGAELRRIGRERELAVDCQRSRCGPGGARDDRRDLGLREPGHAGDGDSTGFAVSGVAIISVSPGSQTGSPATQLPDVQLTNPTEAAVTYYVYGQTTGIAISGFNVNSNQPNVTVGPDATVDVPVQVTSYADATPGDNAITVTAFDANNSSGASGSVQAILTIAGQPIPQSNPNAYGVVAALTPSQADAGQGTFAQYVVQLTNTGSTDETFSLEADGLPIRGYL